MKRITQASPATPVRYAALIDVENLLFRNGKLLDHDESALVLNQVRSHIGQVLTRTAVGPSLVGSHMPAVAAFGGGITLTNSCKDAADQALLEAGQAFSSHGVTDLFIASGDHAFVGLASIARLHVIAHPASLSRRLRLAATSVTLLDSSRVSHVVAGTPMLKAAI